MPTWRARVILNEPLGLLDYRIPDDLLKSLRPGTPVIVPLGRRRTTAYIAEITDNPLVNNDFELKDLECIDDTRPLLPPSLIRLLLFAADYYLLAPGEMLMAALPANARAAQQRYTLSDAGSAALGQSDLNDKERALLTAAQHFNADFTVRAIESELKLNKRTVQSRLQRALSKGYIVKKTAVKKQPRQVWTYQRTVPVSSIAELDLNEKLTQLLSAIPDTHGVTATQLCDHHPAPAHLLQNLEKRGLISKTKQSQRLVVKHHDSGANGPVTPTPAQAQVINAITSAISAGQNQTFLLQGVTGSGKTEVYLQIIAHALAQGKNALVLVPEIALTPQLGAHFRNRFDSRVATFHSGLTVAERRDEWERIATGQACIGLGARSALFLPLQNIGVIVVDEEHDASFKQDETPRYHARDLAVVRGRFENAVVVLGSATPSLESRFNANNNRYRHLQLNERVFARPLPTVEIVQITPENRVGEGIFTEPLAAAIDASLSANEQVILFLNRRGFAPYVFCCDCGKPFRCQDCDVSLTLHRRRNVLLCHYCAYEQPAPDTCPTCQSKKVEAFGLGTERLEAEVRTLFPDVVTARLDRDTVRKRSDLESMISDFREGKSRILIGTQMVAKGHDFPGVTCVGVIAADSALNLPDFRAAERTFQLLTQVGGRAGRGEKPGRVIIQTYDPSAYAIQCAAQHDYESFITTELAARQELSYPPFAFLGMVRCEGALEKATEEWAQSVADSMRERALTSGLEVSILGPAAAPIARIKTIWRFHILLKGATRNHLRQILAFAAHKSPPPHIKQIIDIDPLNML